MSCSSELEFMISTMTTTSTAVGSLDQMSSAEAKNQGGMELLPSNLFSMGLSSNSSVHGDLKKVDERNNRGESELNIALDNEHGNQQNQNDFKEPRNITEHVRVPSSAHVAEIVGRQGYKIRSLRAKTNTYINTPLRGEEPVFFIRGTKGEVAVAQREILTAAEHFSKIRASASSVSCRKARNTKKPAKLPPITSASPKSTPSPVPAILATKLSAKAQVTIFVNVPHNLVGLVVGLRGVTIKRIQELTHTFILTPTREMDPYFEVTGLPDNVQQAKREIEEVIEHAGNIAAGGQRSAPVSGRGNETGPGAPSSQPNHWRSASQEEILASLNMYGLKGLEERHGMNLGYGIVKKDLTTSGVKCKEDGDPYLLGDEDGLLIDPFEMTSTNPREGGLLWGFDLGEDRGPWTRPAEFTSA